MDFGFIKKPVIQDTTFSLSGYSRLVADGNTLYSLSSQVSNNFTLLEKPEMKMGITGSFSWDSATDESEQYWTPNNAIKTGGAVDLSAVFNTADDQSLADALRIYAGYHSDSDGKGLSLDVSNKVTFTNKDFNGYLKLSGSVVKGNHDYWSFTVELGADAGLPELLSL